MHSKLREQPRNFERSIKNNLPISIFGGLHYTLHKDSSFIISILQSHTISHKNFSTVLYRTSGDICVFRQLSDLVVMSDLLTF